MPNRHLRADQGSETRILKSLKHKIHLALNMPYKYL